MKFLIVVSLIAAAVACNRSSPKSDLEKDTKPQVETVVAIAGLESDPKALEKLQPILEQLKGKKLQFIREDIRSIKNGQVVSTNSLNAEEILKNSQPVSQVDEKGEVVGENPSDKILALTINSALTVTVVTQTSQEKVLHTKYSIDKDGDLVVNLAEVTEGKIHFREAGKVVVSSDEDFILRRSEVLTSLNPETQEAQGDVSITETDTVFKIEQAEQPENN